MKVNHGHLMSKNDPLISPLYGTLLSIKHIMMEYRTYIEFRKNVKLPENLLESLGHNMSSLAATIDFIKKTNLSQIAPKYYKLDSIYNFNN